MKRLRLAAAALVCTLTACKPHGTQPPQATGPTGQLSGTIHFLGQAPAPIPLDITMDPGCVTPGAPLPPTEQYIVHDGALANVFLSIQSGPPAVMSAQAPSAAPVILDQKNCVYTPHVIALQRGGTVEFRNSDPTMHTIDTIPTDPGNRRIDLTQGPHGAPRTTQFLAPESMIPVRCSLHPWMNAFINVAPTPFFAISGPTGHYSIANLPPGDYTLAATHEKLGERTLHVTIKPGATTQADLTFSLNSGAQ